METAANAVSGIRQALKTIACIQEAEPRKVLEEDILRIARNTVEDYQRFATFEGLTTDNEPGAAELEDLLQALEAIPPLSGTYMLSLTLTRQAVEGTTWTMHIE